jgi:putative transposase
VSYTWVRRGERKRIPYENPAGRRVNALAALDKHNTTPALYWAAKAGSFQADHLLRFFSALPAVTVPTVVVMDNGSIHRSKVVTAAKPALWQAGVYLYYLPPYSPHLNAIEPVFRVIKHQGLPERRYTTVPALIAAVDTAFTTYEEHLITKHQHQLRSAA